MTFLDLQSENDFHTVDSEPTSLSCETNSLFNEKIEFYLSHKILQQDKDVCGGGCKCV